MMRYPYELPPLPFGYAALEPYIDADTMYFHHDKHFATYIKNLNDALASHPELQDMTLEELLRDPEKLPKEQRQTILNNGGGVYNHNLFFKGLAPPQGDAPRMPGEQLMALIDAAYGSFEAFKKAFSELAASVFGSGWACLAIDGGGQLRSFKLANQETAVPNGMATLMLFDVWEHAYYLKYKNLRADYIKALWNVIAYPELRLI